VYSRAFSTFLKEKIGVDNDRGYITFYDPSKFDMLLTALLSLSFLRSSNPQFPVSLFAFSLSGIRSFVSEQRAESDNAF
jgi:hypothetical protein